MRDKIIPLFYTITLLNTIVNAQFSSIDITIDSRLLRSNEKQEILNIESDIKRFFLNTTWDNNFMGTLHSVDINNHSSYTDALGQANTMFGPQVFMVSDTVIVYVGYTDSIYDVEYMKTFSVILEGDTTYE